MRLGVLLLLLVPVAAMVAGFLLAARQLVRDADRDARELGADGRPILRRALGAWLVSRRGRAAVPGPGMLALTDREIVFERFFPRREFRVGLERLTGARLEPSRGAGQSLVLEWPRGEAPRGDGVTLSLPDAEGWVEAIRRAGACPARASADPRPRTGTDRRP